MRIGERQVWLAIAVWLMMAALPVVGQEASPLAVRVTVEASEMPLVNLLDELERQSGCRFSYESSLLGREPAATVAFHALPLAEALDRLFASRPIAWRQTGRYVILRAARRLVTVSGFVRDASSQETLLSASVWDRARNQGTVTNHYGYYSLLLPQGKVRLRASYVGFASRTVELDLRSDTVVNFSLSSLGQLDEVLVIGSSFRQEALRTRPGVEELQPQRVQALPNLLGEADMVRSLQYLPGVAVGDDGLTTLSVRGGNTDENLYLFDGNPLYYVSHVMGVFSAFNPDALKNITFYKGAFPAEYGGRLSSVVDVRMRDGDLQAYHGNISVGLLSARANLEGPIVKGRSSFNVSVRRSWMDLLMKPIVSIINTGLDNKKKIGYYFFDINTKVSHAISDRSRIYASFYMGQDALLFGHENKEADTRDVFLWRWGNLVGSAGWNQVISPTLFLNMTAGYSRFRSRIKQDYQDYERLLGGDKQLYAETQDYRSAIEDWSTRATFDWTPSPRHRARFGVDYLYHQFRPENSERMEQVATNEASWSEESTLVRGHELSLHAEDEIHVDDYLWVNLGGRYTLFRVDGRDYHSLQPRLSARFRVRPDFSIKLAYDKMNQYVHRLSNTYVNQPTDIWVPVTDDIPPMSSHQVQLGFYYDFGRDYAFSMESFYKFMNNVIEYKDNWAPSADYRGWEERVGIGKGESYGFEWMARKKRGKTTGWISYTLSWTDRYYPDGSVNKGDRFPFRYDNRHKVNLLVTHKLSPKLELSAAWTFATGNRISVSEYRYLSPVVIKGDGAQFASIGYSAQWTANIFNNVGLSERNNYRLAPYHRLDLNLNWYRSNRKGRQSIWSFGLYNAYASPNAFMTELEMYLGPDGKLSPRLKKTVLFFCVPSVSYTFKF